MRVVMCTIVASGVVVIAAFASSSSTCAFLHTNGLTNAKCFFEPAVNMRLDVLSAVIVTHVSLWRWFKPKGNFGFSGTLVARYFVVSPPPSSFLIEVFDDSMVLYSFGNVTYSGPASP